MSNRHEVVAVLDRSGSMSQQALDVIGGFNTYITNIAKDSEKEGVDTYVTLVLFDDKVDVIYTSIPVQNLEPLTEQVFFTRGSTALLDAVGTAIETCKTAVANIKTNVLDALVDKIENVTVTFAIFTDGEENASKKYKSEEVSETIKELSNEGWTFLYLGAGQETWKAAKAANSLNIACGNVRAYGKKSEDFEETFSMMSSGTLSRMRETQNGVGATMNFFDDATRIMEEEAK